MKLQHTPVAGYYIVIERKGRPVRVELGTHDEAEAIELVKMTNIAQIELAAKAGQLSQRLMRRLSPGNGVSVAQAIEGWHQFMLRHCESQNTMITFYRLAHVWARETGNLRQCVNTITEDDIAPWINKLDGRKLSTKGVKLAAVRNFFRWCMGSGREYCVANPAELVRIRMKLLTHEQKEPKKKTVFTDEEVAKVLKYIERRYKRYDLLKPTPGRRRILRKLRFWLCAVKISRHTALRLGDIANLEWECLATRGKIIVWTDKSNKRVEIDIDPAIVDPIKLSEGRSTRLCFPEQAALANDAARRGFLSVNFKNILKGCGLGHMCFHLLRHTALSEIVNQGGTLEDAAKIAGHSSIETTRVYWHRPSQPPTTGQQ